MAQEAKRQKPVKARIRRPNRHSKSTKRKSPLMGPRRNA